MEEVECHKDASIDSMTLRDLIDIRDATPDQAPSIDRIKAMPDDDEYFYENMQEQIYHIDQLVQGDDYRQR